MAWRRLAAMAVTALAVTASLAQSGRLSIADLLPLLPQLVFVVWAARAFWARAPYAPEQVVVARDRVGYQLNAFWSGATEWPIVAVDRSTGAVAYSLSPGQAPIWKPIPGLPAEPIERDRVFDRIEQALERPLRQTGDEALAAGSFAELQTALGMKDRSAGPFRSAGDLDPVRASRLLGDLSASRAELLSAAMVRAARGDAADRRRIEAVADEFTDPHFAALLRAIARDDPQVEVAYQAMRRKMGRAELLFSRLLRPLVGLFFFGAAASLALSGTSRDVLVGLGLVAVLGEVRRAASRADVLGRWFGVTARRGGGIANLVALIAATLAVRLLGHGAMPAVLVPTVLYLACWLPSAFWLRPTAAVTDPSVEAVATAAVERPEGTGVRVEVDAAAETEGGGGEDLAASAALARRAGGG